MRKIRSVVKKIKPIDAAIIATLLIAIGIAGYVSCKEAGSMQDGAVAYYSEQEETDIQF